MNSIDLNCDMGESFGVYSLGNDVALMDYVSSVNIACGFHAGDPGVMRETVRHALEKSLAIGAHPGLPDLAGFGRRTMAISPREAYDMVVYQIGALYGFVRAAGGHLHHVKPHGALYNMAAQDTSLAAAIAQAVKDVDPTLILYGLSGSTLILAGEAEGLRVANEVFADRTYQSDGTLTPRSQPDALIHHDDEALNQVLDMVSQGKVQATDGQWIDIQADTICIHGDGAHALEFAVKIHQTLQQSAVVQSM
ncbi:LamB/YcsF family protein [Vibrio ruber DSM 16370]|uniref:5-oxoprolinase subunit A n=1 Tax=Vibrio ruber (strain DSM 16370 / JCM 11486 / BCRC 17186 / CECT 7878 / LMG 23124 / VR1) TaxID=1123498 RepID=A0A1R4LCT6_VIBR1|nr:5-oxoprolinase subunit PxpA [Vibrio ruber]SJN54338.1 LamB/YcsF family protein [Vibrio ruber DSM 16370]